MSHTVAVAGASGYLGRHVVAALAEHGYHVRALVRSRAAAEKPGRFGAPGLADLVSQWQIVDYELPRTLDGVFDGVDRVVSALGVTRQKADPWNVDFLGNLRLLEEAEASGVQSFCYVNVIHSHTGTSTTMRAKHAFSQVLRRSTVAAQLVNPSGYFSDMTDFWLMARKGWGFVVGDGEAHLNPIHGADLAEFIVSKLTGPAGEWDIGGPDVFTYRSLQQLMFELAGRPGHVVKVGPRAAKALVGVADRSSPQAGNLARFFLEGLQIDAAGTPYGNHHLADFLRDQ